MKALAIILTLGLGVGFLGLAVYLSKTQPVPTGIQGHKPTRSGGNEEDEPIPKPAPFGPHPKAVAPETEYDFGSMPMYSKGHHSFVIKNEGEAPLEIVARKKETTCQCTVGKAGEKIIAPGGETTVELNWEIKSPSKQFRHTAKVRTNDPKNEVIELVISGIVDKDFYVIPESLWDLGIAEDNNPATASGVLFSRVKKEFEITKMTCSNPRVTCTSEPMTEEDLAKYEALSGHKVTVTADMHDLIGYLNESVEIQSSISESKAAQFAVRARRLGPFEIVARQWDSERSTLMIGEIPAGTGKTLEVSVFVKCEKEVQMVSAELKHQAVKVSWKKDEKFKAESKTKRYLLKIEIPPGPVISRLREEAEEVKLKFDNPDLGDFTIFVSYLAT